MATTLDSSPAAYFAKPQHYLSQDGRLGRRGELIRELLVCRPERVLDLGCGNGALSLPLGARMVTLVDQSAGMIEEARRLAKARPGIRARCIHDDLRTFEPDQGYDLVLCIGVLSYMPDAGEIIAKISAALPPGGMAIIQLSDGTRIANRAASLARELFRGSRQTTLSYAPTTRAQIVRSAGWHGLRLVDERSHMLAPPWSGPSRLMRTWDRIVAATPLARLGMETLLAFRKD